MENLKMFTILFDKKHYDTDENKWRSSNWEHTLDSKEDLEELMKGDSDFEGCTIFNNEKVDKKDFEVFEFSGGYYGISKIGSAGGVLVHGGDSANEDNYDGDTCHDLYKNWNGNLIGDEDNGYYIDVDDFLGL